MPMRGLMISVVGGFLLAGCGPRASAPASQALPQATENTTTTVAEPDLSNVLAELTQTLRRYSAEKRQVPASLDVLVAAGYIQQVPQAPAGKSFAVDQKNVRVVLK